ncbi:sulfatase [Paraferrimonas sp. SM1919]|uniref:sulfatase family protein n=1 Tax=Paraferrimonas sp. SM1919 TaxID=2662263 RepID=UPI0013D4CAFF|nr:sulfatase [Paraferrimonas sp. SM1919]
MYKKIITNTCLAFFSCLIISGCSELKAKSQQPNIIIIFADDLGYGDLGYTGHPTIATPNIDAMAQQGQKWTNFYSASSSCTPSRAALLTGRYAIRSGMQPKSLRAPVLLPFSLSGLPHREQTIAEMLKPLGYQSALFGKWHLGSQSQHLPLNHGFDEFIGIPYSNDMDSSQPSRVYLSNNPDIDHWPAPSKQFFNVPLIKGFDVIERPHNQYNITERLTEWTIDFIERQHQAKTPFFSVLAYTQPHVPEYASPKFAGTSARGVYGDSVAEIDWSVGQILNKLKALDIADNTLVIFTSDNGPWLVMDKHGGTTGGLRGAKATTWEGGQREPAIYWMPGTVKAGTTERGVGSTLDLLPTIAALTGAPLPNTIIDGKNQLKTLTGLAPSASDEMFFWGLTDQVYAVRKGAFKAHFVTHDLHLHNAPASPTVLEQPLLFNVNEDPSERFNIAHKHPEIVKQLSALRAQHLQSIEAVEFELEKLPNNRQKTGGGYGKGQDKGTK